MIIVDYTEYIREPELWYYVSLKQIQEHGGRGLLNHYGGSLIRTLRAAFPEQNWISWRFSHNTPHNVIKRKSAYSKNQYILYQKLQSVSDATDFFCPQFRRYLLATS